MRKGKLGIQEMTENIFSVIKRRRDEVIVGAESGEDCASLHLDDTILVSTDPITGSINDAGTLAIIVNANDIYCAGGSPVAATLTIIAPPSTQNLEIRKIVEQAESECKKRSIEIIGGHTEFSDAVNRIIVSVTIIGTTKKRIRSTTAQVGDDLIVTKDIATEGTFILFSEKRKELESEFSNEEISLIEKLCGDISIKDEAEVALQCDVSAMHDVTEGGLFGAVAEMADAAGVGVTIDGSAVPIKAETVKLCDLLGINPYRLISSGSLLIATANGDVVTEALRGKNIKATKIGVFTESKEKLAVFGDRIQKVSVTSDELFSIKIQKR